MTTASVSAALRDASASTAADEVRRLAERRRIYVRTLVACDAVVIAAAIFGGYLARFSTASPPRIDVPYGLIGVTLGLAWLIWLRTVRCYDERVLGYGTDEYRRVAGASARLAGTVAILGYIVNIGVSRSFLAIAFLMGTVGLITARWVARKRLHRARSRGAGWSHRVLVVGDAAHVLELVRQLRREPYTGYRVVGACIPDGLLVPRTAGAPQQRLGDVPVVGSFRNIVEAATGARADTIAVTGSNELTASRLRRLGWQLEGSGMELVVAPALVDVAGPRIHTRPVAGLPLIHVEQPDFAGGTKIVKNVVERILAIGGLLVALPVLVLVAIAVKLDSRGPILFRQRRVGQHGIEFDVFKFRTMVVDADQLVETMTGLNETNGLMFKMRQDPRVTRVGRILRKYSLDELPQLVNVVRGDMSLVGPRPPLPKEVAKYDGDVARRLLVKPGITGLWQVSGRSDLSWEDGIRLDLYYVENWSLTSDLSILWKTVGAVVRSRGAY
ncbi:sugar transferase [Hamadaea sp. NPDC051192]|uniref:sugar transferase n=1 Tax=Hamadaea sp. NPDC051192 TaxID=3154940 RepID=UPI00344546FF